MLAIIVSACLATDPASCRDYSIPLDASVDPTQCVMHAPPFIAKWGEEHPHLVVTKFACRPTSANDI